MYVKITVIPRSKKDGMEEIGPSRFRVSVREKAERNLANAKATELVAAHFGVPARKVRIISGHRSPSKLLSIDTDEQRPAGV